MSAEGSDAKLRDKILQLKKGLEVPLNSETRLRWSFTCLMKCAPHTLNYFRLHSSK